MKTRPAVLPMRMSFSSLSSSRKGLPTSRQFIGMSNLRDQSFSYSNRQASCPASLIEDEMTGSTWSFHKIASGWSTSEKTITHRFPPSGFFGTFAILSSMIRSISRNPFLPYYAMLIVLRIDVCPFLSLPLSRSFRVDSFQKHANSAFIFLLRAGRVTGVTPLLLSYLFLALNHDSH